MVYGREKYLLGKFFGEFLLVFCKNGLAHFLLLVVFHMKDIVTMFTDYIHQKPWVVIKPQYLQIFAL